MSRSFCPAPASVTQTDAQLTTSDASGPSPLFVALSTAALLALATFAVGAQSNGTRAGVVEVLAVLLATAVFGRAAYNGKLPRPFNASLGLLFMTLFAGLTALSVSWSLLPNESLLDSVRLISYTCVLALAAFLAQLHQDRAREIVLGTGLAALLIILYALASRCIPGIFPETDYYARIRLPYGYWNAVGAVAAIGFLIALWAGTRRITAKWLEVISYPAGGLFLVALMMSQSRGALLALAIALGAWCLIVPQRLRAAGWLAVVGFFGLIVVAWVYNKAALSTDYVALPDRKSAGVQLLAALVLLCGVLTGLGLLVRSQRYKRPLPEAQRRKIGKAILIALAIAPIVVVIGIGVGTDKGLGTISSGVSDFFSTGATAPANSPDRLTQTTSLRGRYWNESWKIFKVHVWSGTGGDTFRVARLPFRTDQLIAGNAHGMVPQVASDLGIFGLLILFGLMAVWLVAAFKLAGASKRAPWQWLTEADETRLASVTLMIVALFFGLHSAIDWIWFVPGVAFFGLLAGGWTLGTPAAHSAPAAAPQAAPERGGKLQIARAIAIAVVGISIAYAVYQPVRAVRKVDAGLDAASDHPAKALKLGQQALDLDPTSNQAYMLISVAQSNAGNDKAAEATLNALVTRQPGNPNAWLRLARFRLYTLDNPDGAIRALRPLLYQSPNNLEGLTLLEAARKAKVDALLQAIAEKKRKKLEKELERLEKLQKQATAAANGAAATA